MQVADSNSTSSFYVYLHRRATDGRVFYVGKGNSNRADSLKSRSQYWKNIVAKNGYTVEFVQRDIQEWYAFELEKELIAYYGRENLCNLTDGGEGSSGFRHSPESIVKMSISSSGKKHSIETKNKMSAWQKTKKLTPEHIKKIAERNRTRCLSKESLLKNSKSQPSNIKVICIENGLIFHSIKEAARYLNLHDASISRCCQGKQKQTQGFRFKYATS